MKRKHRILIFNGGRGATNIINYFQKKELNFKITSIVNAYDDGKSTGNIRDIFNILGPSDIRKVQSLFIPKNNDFNQINMLFNLRITLSTKKEFFSIIDDFINKVSNNLFGIRFKNKQINNYLIKNLNFFYKYLLADKNKYKKLKIKDLSLMNCIYASSILLNNNKISKSIEEFNKIFKLTNTTFSISNDIRYLCAIEKKKKVYYSEEQIVEKRSNSDINNIFLLKNKINKQNFNTLNFESKNKYLKNNNSSPFVDKNLHKIIKNSDLIIYAPGTQHSSLYPTYMHLNLAKLIKNNKKAKKIFITNIGADYETPNYDSFDYVQGAYKYLSGSEKKYKFNDFFDYILINKNKNNNKKKYVNHNQQKFLNINTKLIIKNFETKNNSGKHDGRKIYKIISELL